MDDISLLCRWWLAIRESGVRSDVARRWALGYEAGPLELFFFNLDLDRRESF